MSVGDNLSMFQRLDNDKNIAHSSHARHVADRRKKLQRHRTQPVTEDEVKMATVLATHQGNRGGAAEKETASGSDDELSKLSLADKVRLFSEKQAEKEKEIMKNTGPRRRPRRMMSRFRTQSSDDEPVTSDEVANASRISPLAMSLVKPPDPEILQQLSFHDQREFTANWAKDSLAQMSSGSRSSSQQGSRRGSAGVTEDVESGEEKGFKGILKTSDSHPQTEVRGILKRSSSEKKVSGGVKGILKVEPLSHEDTDQHHGILKRNSSTENRPEGHSILKKESSFEARKDQPEKSVLKKQPSFELKGEPMRSALRKEPSVESKGETSPVVLKKTSSFEAKAEPDKGVLKSPVTHQTKEVKGILKEPSFEVESHGEPHGILKGDSFHKESDVDIESDDCCIAITRDVEDVRVDCDIALCSTSSPDVSATEEQSPGGALGPVARRRIQREKRKKNERYHTQPVEGSSDSSPRTPSDAKRLSARHLTQPITCDEKHDAEDGAVSVVKTGGSVANRLAALQKSGEDDWRKRIGKGGDPAQRDALAGVKRCLIPTTPLADRPHSIAVDSLLARQLGSELADSLAASGGDRVRPSGIANRLSCLEGAQANWRNRVGQKDVRQFTVEGKLSAAGKTGESPLTTRRRQIPKAQLNRESESSNGPTPTSPTKSLLVPFSQPNGARTPQRSRDASPSSSTPNLFVSVDTPSFRVTPEPCESAVPEPREVEVLKADDETFTRFFEGSTVADIHSERIEVTVDDFDHLFIESQDILMSARKARPQQRKTPGSRNPVKKLAARQDLQGTYTEVRTNVAERELKRIKRERVIGTVPLAQEALAGLASDENFSKVTLKKTSSFGAATPGEKLLPYKDLMLLHIKGRRHCQLRLVEPSVHSINSGDCFLLVTPDRLFVWIGEYANVMEKAKANELSTYIYQKRDLGCKLSSLPDIIPEEKQHFGAGQRFWELLGGQEDYKDPGPLEEDESYEECLEETTKVFLVQQEELVPVPEYSNVPLRHAMLNNKQVLVFDFGSEVYLWTGKQVPFAQRKVGLRLVQELWDKGYDYTGSETNPFSPLHKEGDEGGYPLKADRRPDWALLGKVNANMETTAFKEKFIDWPDSARLIKVKEPNDNGKSTDSAAIELTSCDVTAMLAIDTSPVTLLLEGSNVGRGNTWVENRDGLRREFEVDTLSVDMWHVLEYEQYQMEPLCFGQLHNYDTYVIRWRYRITQSGMRDLKGNAVNRQTRTGRERCAYFFWQGRESSVTEKGASALMTVELDEERGPQVRVVQGKEPPCFINLFSDTVMVTHFGKREDADTNTGGKYRLYIVRNELPTEAYLMEVTCACTSLRSRTSFLLLNAHTGWLGVWHGVKSSEAVRARAMELAQRLEKRCPAEVGLHPDASIRVKEMEEAEESSQFWAAMDTNDRSVYDSLLSDRTSRDHTARLFHMSSVSGVFEAKEVVNSCHSTEVYSPFPFQQSDLYSASQPGLFMIDTQYAVYVWSGWWPEETNDEDNVKTGSAEARFNIDRRCALETAINYCKEKNTASPPSGYLVYAGLEPLSFTNMFPTWKESEGITDINLAEGRRQDEMVVIEDLLAKLARTKYPWAELQERPLPEGVDPLKLEFYLVDDEFEELLGMSRSEFYNMPVWKQGNLKKEIGIF